MEATMEQSRLMGAQAVDLVTYKRDGTPVHTPVLSTPRDGALLIRTHHTAAKLKRLSRNPEVTVAPSNGHARSRGLAERGTAVILPATETDECLRLLHRRHGLIGLVSTWIRHMKGMRDVFIEVRLV